LSRKKAGFGAGVWIAFILLVAVFVVVLDVPLVKGSGIIYIRAGGNIDPPTAPISTVDNLTYTFTDNIYDPLVVERNNVVVNGAGHVLEGTGSGNGMYLNGRSNVTIKNITIKQFSYGIYLSSSSGNTLSANTINASTGIFLDSSAGNNISSNNISNINGVGIFLGSSSNNSISANTLTNNANGIYLYASSSNNSISTNTITNANYGISLDHSANNNSISANTIANNTNTALYLYFSSNNNSISANTITNDIIGISIGACSNNSVSSNIITNNTNYGVVLSSSDASIFANNITNNNNGIYIYGSSNNNISANTVTNNNYGVWLNSALNNSVSANTIRKNNNYGIVLSYSSNNTVFHNNFMNNSVQAIVTLGYVNIWDDGYPSGGNSWSDFKDVDYNKGPYQNITGYDGIWDNPYIIDSANKDRYPLIPFETQPPTIAIQAPENKTYTVKTSIPLTFTVDEFVRWIGYSLNWQQNTTITGNITLPALSDGGNYLVVYANDTFNNMGVSNNIHFTVDTTAPTGSVIINNGDAYTTLTSVTLSLTATDLTSGVSQIRFSNDGVWDTEVWEGASASKSWTLASGDGIKTVYYQIKDNAGLISSTYPDTIILDTTLPTGSIIINSGDASTISTGVTLTLTYSDGGSGVSQIRFSNDGVWDTETWESASASKAWTLTSGDGVKTVYYQIKDNAGLESTTYSDTITLQTSTPTPTPTPAPAQTQAPSTTPKPTVNSTATPSPIPTATPRPSITPSPSIQTTATPIPQQPKENSLILYVIIGAAAFAAIGATVFMLKRKR
jgi:parallel beta-helix repeat protein